MKRGRRDPAALVHDDGEGRYTFGDGSCARSELRYRLDLEEAGRISELTSNTRAFKHCIIPKYCRMVGIDPGQMWVSLTRPNLVRDYEYRVDNAFKTLNAELPLSERIWKAHALAGGWSRMDIVAKLFFKMEPPVWHRGERPPLLSVEWVLSDPGKLDASTWLASPEPGVERSVARSWSAEKSRRFLTRMQRSFNGPTLVGNFRRQGMRQYPSGIVLELPEEPSARCRVFRWARTQRRYGVELMPRTDEGYDHAFLVFAESGGSPTAEAHPAPARPASAAQRGKAAAAGNQLAKRLLAYPDKEEILSWLKAARKGQLRTLGELGTQAKSRALARQVYRLGARRVWAVEIDRKDESENSGKLVVRLPAASSKRKHLFAWAAQWAQRAGYDPYEDEGQEYLFVMLD